MTRHDKHELPEWLEEQFQEIDLTIGVLRASEIGAFSLSSSPVEVLVSLLVDLLMRIKNSYEHGIPETERRNSAVVFLDDEPMGELGNSNQKTINFKSQLNWSPSSLREDSPMPFLIRELARFFSRSLRPDFCFGKEFVHLYQDLAKLLPPGFISQKSHKAEKRNKNRQTVQANARTFYHRRRQFK